MKRDLGQQVTCPKCNGRGLVTITWINADMREKQRNKTCSSCNGTGKLLVRLPYRED